MKIEGVKNGFADLLMRIDGKGKPLEFNNMQEKQISGTIGWKKHTITLPFHENAKQIFVGGLLTGEGQVWFDGLKVFIDGKRIEDLEPVEQKIAAAELDDEFEDGSKVDIEELSISQIQHLYKLGKVWGFTKYYHPQIAAGNFNWDYELLRILPQILNTTHLSEANEFMRQWIEGLGPLEVKGEKHSNISSLVKLDPNLDWIEQDTSRLGSTLKVIIESERFDKHYYVGLKPGVGNPIFRNEDIYRNMEYTDEGLKLLSLFRYWCIIEYFFPYRYLMDQDWDTILLEFIPKIIGVNDELSYKLVLLELIGKIQDTHANIWQNDAILDSYWGKHTPPIVVRFIEGKFVVTKVLDKLSGTDALTVGDVITQVNGKDIMALMEEKIKYCPASNRPTQIRDVAKKLLRTNQKIIDVNVEGKGELRLHCVNISDLDLQNKNLASHKLLNSNIGYIYPGSLKKDEIHEIMDKFLQTEGLIIDLRCYPSDFIVFSLSQYLLSKPTAFVKFTTGNLRKPGQFLFTKPLKVGKINNNAYVGKVIIIVDETTQSQAEYTAMALRASPQATIIGSTTAGADGNVSEIFLPGNIRTMISGIGVYYPDGRETQRVGIIPDKEIKPTIKSIANDKDELLEYAIDLIEREYPGR